MDTKGLQKEFISWCKSKNKSPKTKEETQQLFVSFMKEKHPEEYKKAVESQQQQQAQQAQKALHGAKLQYFKKLKNQCAEDEEVVYYKQGGSVNCGCKKKEDGGEVRKAGLGCSAIDKFKKMKSGKKITIKQQPQVNPSDTVHVNGIAYSVTNSDGSPVDKRFKPYSGKVEEEDRKKAKKGDKDAQKRQLKQDLASSEKCGGKVKKHKQGGSLNGILFYQGGTPKGGIRYRYSIEKPTPNSNFQLESFITSPDQFGRQLEVERTIAPREDGTFRNDTTYRATSYLNGELNKTSWNYRDNGKVYIPNNSGDRSMTPGNVLGRNRFKNWGDYFEYLLSLKNK